MAELKEKPGELGAEEKPRGLGPLKSVHTESFARLLEAAGVSVLVSTYQAGRLIVLRAAGGVVNTHFRVFDVPMGMAVKGHRLVVATRTMIWELGNYPQVGKRLPTGVEGVEHDACFMPSRGHVTGDVRTHEMAWGGADGRELWFVNTRFSCLCTLAEDCSFVPRWRPGFVTALSNEDRCHLNGLWMRGGRPGLVTALGRTDSPEEWRAGKIDGGVILDVATGGVVAEGLCMPHSPREYDGRVWVCESGKGTVASIGARGVETLVELPGFTRGLDFWDRYAFVGLSKVREKYFSGLPMTDRTAPEDRKCGVWVVDIVEGRVVAFVEFTSGVEEVFDVKVLHGVRFPEVLDLSMPESATSYVLPEQEMTRAAEPRISPYAEEDAAEAARIRGQPSAGSRRGKSEVSDQKTGR